jgi:alpha-glucosidase
MAKKLFIAVMVAAFGMTALLSRPGPADTEYSLFSPDKKIEVRIAAGATLAYSVRHKGGDLIAPSAISMSLEGGRVLGRDAEVRDARRRSVDEKLSPVVKQKAAVIADRYNELTLEFKDDYAVTFRAYDDGAAYRFSTSFPSQITVVSEQAEFAFTKIHRIYFPEEESFYTHQERLYKYIPMNEITAKKFCSVPALVDVEGGPKVAITEADLEDYAGLYLTGLDDAPTKLVGKFPAYPLKEQPKGDRNVLVTERAGYIAKTAGKRAFPWRVLMIAEKDGGLIESPMIYRLARPSTGDFSWVRPGKVAWDWWNDLNVSGVNFRAGVNTATYKYFIDFAAKYGIEYIILDEGWYKRGDLLTVVPALNMAELIAYGKEKHVGIILWVTWKTLDDQLEPAMNQFSRWGIQGLKVDFMQRDDQWMVNYYYRIAAEAARRHLLVDFHGAYKPTGLFRTFPNVLTSEGVRGLENSKWSKDITPNHDVHLPFIRMAAGPMDFTPGAMINGTQRNFQFVYNQPMSQGTRCHQLAMYVVYESPLQMLADTPTNYLREPEAMAFLSRVPTVWDETLALDGKVGEYVLVARRNGSNWYVAAMTSWTPRDLPLDLSFLGEGNHEMILYQDGINADRNGSDFRMITRTVTKADKLDLKLAPGGGWAAIISPKSR